MPQLLDIKAFLVTARTGSFSAAAREIGLAASVVTKRVSRLEEQIGSALFQRTTRRLTLTSEGERLRPRLQLLIAEIDEALRSARVPEGGVAGQLRVKSPTTVGMLYVGGALARFQARNPRVKIELLLVDRAVNPLEEGFDVALGGLPVSFSGVLDLPLCQYDRVLVAAPAYLADNPAPRSPNDLVAHDCLAFLPIGLEWSFESDQGAIVVEIRARFTANDSQVLLTAALEGLGITVAPRFLAREALAEGRLVAVLADYPLPPLWFKAMVPRSKVNKPEVAALVEHLKAEFGTVPPWDR
jgi:DNA-binding transcriptional LysR family regulator